MTHQNECPVSPEIANRPVGHYQCKCSCQTGQSNGQHQQFLDGSGHLSLNA